MQTKQLLAYVAGAAMVGGSLLAATGALAGSAPAQMNSTPSAPLEPVTSQPVVSRDAIIRPVGGGWDDDERVEAGHGAGSDGRLVYAARSYQSEGHYDAD